MACFQNSRIPGYRVKTKNIAKREKNEAVSFLNSIHNYSSALIYYLETRNKGDISDVFFTVSAGKCYDKLQELQFYRYFCCPDKDRYLTKSQVLSAP
jgi:hypothetical protein